MTRIGLMFDIIGVLLLAMFGVPQPDFDEGVGLGLEDATTLKMEGRLRSMPRKFAAGTGSTRARPNSRWY